MFDSDSTNIASSVSCTASFATGILLHVAFFRLGEWDLYTPHLLASTAILQAVTTFVLSQYGPLPGVSLIEAGLLVALHIAACVAGIYSSILVYRATFHRLNRFPGPFLARLSNAYITSKSVKNFHLFEEVAQLHSKYGDIVRIGPSELSIADPNAYALIHSNKSPCKKALREYEPRVEEYTQQLLSVIQTKSGTPVNASTLFNFYSFDIMGDLAFGDGFNMLKDGIVHYYMSSVHEGMLAVSAFSHLIWIFPLIKAIPGLNKEHLKFQSWLANHVNTRRQKKMERRDLFSWLLDDYESIQKPTAQDLINLNGDAHLIIVAGSDTTAASLTCLFFELAQSPDTIAKLRQELDQYFLENEEPTAATLSKLPYLNACINESLRLHPPIPSGVQRMTPPEGLQLGQAFIPGDTIVQIPTYTLHRDERAFDQPYEFIPDRWTSRPELVRDASAFTPFGTGRYSCAGKQLGLMELRSVISQIVRQYSVRLAPGQKPEDFVAGCKDGFTLSTAKLDLIFETRVAS